MKFFNKYINYFYISFFVLGCVLYLFFRANPSIVLMYFVFAFFIIGLLLLSYASWYKVYRIYRDYIYKSRQEKQEIAYRKQYEIGFAVAYEEEKKFKKSIYKKSQIINLCLGLVSVFVIIYMIVRMFG